MKLYECPRCAQVLHFENVACERCSAPLGFYSEESVLSALEPQGDAWTLHGDTTRTFRYCANFYNNACNWLVPADQAIQLCAACRLNRTIPPLEHGQALERWQALEAAKHRVIYSLLRFNLPVISRLDDPDHGLCFDFLEDASDDPDHPGIVTGHEDGVITINIAEADPARRELVRTRLHESYRTLLGHLRHEVAHHYWDLLIKPDNARLNEFRACFGDERDSYTDALARHYAQGAPPDWQARYVSEYATSHPWEDWAETWAHYMHIVDALETAHAFGIRLRPRVEDTAGLALDAPSDPYRAVKFQQLMDNWYPLTIAVNSLNRSMGQPDLYPFVMSEGTLEKLAFIHTMIRKQRPLQASSNTINFGLRCA